MSDIKPPPNVTFKYAADSEIRIRGKTVKYTKIIRDVNDILMLLKSENLKTGCLKSEIRILKRMIYKYSNPYKHFKSFQFLKRVNQQLGKFEALKLHDIFLNIGKCCSVHGQNLHLISRQMMEYCLLVLKMAGLLLRRTVIFCQRCFEFCMENIYRGHLLNSQLMFCALTSRIWIIARALILYICEWYETFQPWLKHLKGVDVKFTDADLTPGMKNWLDKVSPVKDDYRKLRPDLVQKAQGVLARFVAENEIEDEMMDTSRKQPRESPGDDGSDEGNQLEPNLPGPTGPVQTESNLGVSVSRKRKLETSESQSHGQDIGVRISRQTSKPVPEKMKSSKTAKMNEKPDLSKHQVVSSKKLKKDAKTETPIGKKTKKSIEKKTKQSETKKSAPKVENEPTRVGPDGDANSDGKLTKSELKRILKPKLKKPADFIKDLNENTLSLKDETLRLPKKKRMKLADELTVKLKDFRRKKKALESAPEKRKSVKMAEMKEAKLALKRDALNGLWKLISKKC